MKKILVYYYNEEVEIDSTNSVARLIASLINTIENRYIFSFFVFQPKHINPTIKANPILINITKWSRLIRRLNNALPLKRKHWFDLKRNAVRSYVSEQTNEYDAVLVLGLDDVKEIRAYFPNAAILYWIHNISAICKKQYLYNVNDADYFLSPSHTTYQLLLQKLQPVPLTAEFYFMPNWCEDVFKQENIKMINELKNKHFINSNSIVFIFAGSDLKLKGRFILEKVIKKLVVETDKDLVFLFAGSDKNKGEYKIGNLRIIDVGLLKPEMLAHYYRVASYGCFISLAYDHCPLTLLEMIASNVLPIASDIGGVKEMLGEEYKFLIQSPHSVSDWIINIQRALRLSETERSAITNSLKQRIEQTYSRNSAIHVLEDIMQAE